MLTVVVCVFWWGHRLFEFEIGLRPLLMFVGLPIGLIFGILGVCLLRFVYFVLVCCLIMLVALF